MNTGSETSKHDHLKIKILMEGQNFSGCIDDCTKFVNV